MAAVRLCRGCELSQFSSTFQGLGYNLVIQSEDTALALALRCKAKHKADFSLLQRVCY